MSEHPKYEQVFHKWHACPVVEHYFKSRPYANCQSSFRHASPNSPVHNKSIIYLSIYCFHEISSANDKKMTHLSIETIAVTKEITELCQQAELSYRIRQKTIKVSEALCMLHSHNASM
jgi:hypothetical protein